MDEAAKATFRIRIVLEFGMLKRYFSLHPFAWLRILIAPPLPNECPRSSCN